MKDSFESKYQLLINGREKVGIKTQKNPKIQSTALKRFEYLPLGSGLKKQTSVAEKKYQGLNKFFNSNKKE